MTPAARPGRGRAGVRNVRLVRQPDRLQTRQVLLALLGGLLVLVPLMANIWARAEAVRLGYRISRAHEAREALLEANRLLRVEEASLRDLERVERIAIHDLGLAPRDPQDTVVVTEVGQPAAPDPTRPGEQQVVVARGAGGRP